MNGPAPKGILPAVTPHAAHRRLCTIELIAEGHADRCPEEECAFWERGCALSRIEYELDGRPEVARMLLDLRRELAVGREIDVEEVHARFAHILNEDEGILDAGPRPVASNRASYKL